MSLRRLFIKRTMAIATTVALSGSLMLSAAPSHAADTIKVGVLHSLSGTMAISETVLKDVDADDDRRDQRQGRRARQEARSRSSSTRLRTGRCSPKRRGS